MAELQNIQNIDTTNTTNTTSRSRVIKYVAIDSEGNGWTASMRPTRLMVMIDHLEHKIEWEIMSGPDPDVYNLLGFILEDRDIRKELVWALTAYKRQRPFLVDTYYGSSGCRTYTLKTVATFKGHTWAAAHYRKVEEALCLHVSMADKVPSIPDMFSGDLMELVVAIMADHDPEHWSKGRNLWRWREYIASPRKVREVLPSHKRYSYLKFRASSIQASSPDESVCGLFED